MNEPQDGLGDWRIQAVTRVVQDVPAAFPRGPSHRAGSPIYLTTMCATAAHNNLGFITPSAAALALNAGLRSAERASLILPKIAYQQVLSPEGPASGVRPADLVHLFDYFEEALAAANSSFQAIEAFANETIARLLKGTLPVERRDGPKEMSAEEIERHVSTSEKIATILPKLLNEPSIKGGREWQLFDTLKGVRDSSTHFKSGDQYPLGGRAGKDSLYYLLLNGDPNQFPRTAIRVISCLLGKHERPRWLACLVERYGVS